MAKSNNTPKEVSPSRFTGGAFANFGINFAVVLVSLITVGIAYPFMMCWKLRWEADHTYIDGRKLVFDGNGGQLLGKWLLWMLLSIVTIFIYAIFRLPLNMNRWKAKHTHFADNYQSLGDENQKPVLKPGVPESKFTGSIFGLWGVNWLSNFVTLITLSFGMYWAHCYQERWYAKHTEYDGCKLVFDGKGRQYFGKCFVWVLLTIVTVGIYSFWLTVKVKDWTMSHTHIAKGAAAAAADED